MKTLAIWLLFACFAASADAQSNTKQDEVCGFLDHLKFKNGVDTIVVKATLLDLREIDPPLLAMASFYREQKLWDAIAFKPENCSTEYSVPLKSFHDKKGLFDGDNLGLSIRVTCVVFEKYLHVYEKSPFFIVIKAVPQEPLGSISKYIGGDSTKTPDFLSNLQFKNGIDTIHIKATFHSLYRQDNNLILNKIFKTGLIRTAKPNYQIAFTVTNSAIDFVAPVHLTNDLLAEFPDTKEGQTINLTCIVFDKYYNYGRPYFIVDRWHFEKSQ